MKSLIPALSALAFSGTLFAAIAASATAVDTAHPAHRDELSGIPSYQHLELDFNSRNVSINDIIKAARKGIAPAL